MLLGNQVHDSTTRVSWAWKGRGVQGSQSYQRGQGDKTPEPTGSGVIPNRVGFGAPEPGRIRGLSQTGRDSGFSHVPGNTPKKWVRIGQNPEKEALPQIRRVLDIFGSQMLFLNVLARDSGPP